MEDQTPKKMYDPVRSVALTIFIFFATQILAGLIIGFIIAAIYKNPNPTELIESNTWLHFSFVALVEVLTVYCIWWVLKRRNLGLKDIGIDNPKFKYIAYAVIGFVVYFAAYIVTLMLAKALVPSLNLEQKQELGIDMTAQGKQLLPVFVSLVILPPVAEEIVMRGFLFSGLRTKLQFLPAAVITSILFGAAHLGEASDGLLWVAAIDTFVLSMVLCYLRENTKSLWPSIGLHMMKNGLAFIFLFNVLGNIK